jgi:hypothetical protein
MMSVHERPVDAGRRAGRALAEDRRRRGLSAIGSAGLPPEEMREILADHGVTAGQSIGFLRGFWHGVTTG